MRCSLAEKGKAMTELDKDVIVALADNRMNVTDAARYLCLHRNSVLYHVRKIYQKTGLDALDFHDLCDLYQMVAIERNNNG